MRGSPGRERNYGGSRQPDAMELLQILRPDAAELMKQVLLCIVPKPNASRFTASTSAACGEFIRQYGDYKRNGTAVDGVVTMRSCMTGSTLATVCYLGDFRTTHAQSIEYYRSFGVVTLHNLAL